METAIELAKAVVSLERVNTHEGLRPVPSTTCVQTVSVVMVPIIWEVGRNRELSTPGMRPLERYAE